MKTINHTLDIPQYSPAKILGIWAAAALPMGVLGWIVAPGLTDDPAKQGFVRLAVLTAGLIWQFLVILYLVRREAGDLRWSTLKARLWLNAPRSPETGDVSHRLWLWLIPLLILTAVYEFNIGGYISDFWISVFPFFAEPPGWSLGGFLDSPEGRAQMVGAWDIWALFLVSAVFNTILGEELLFRGLLLPRMNRVFGTWDWVANGVLFGI